MQARDKYVARSVTRLSQYVIRFSFADCEVGLAFVLLSVHYCGAWIDSYRCGIRIAVAVVACRGIISDRKTAPTVGLEPTTTSLKGWRSTD